MTTACTLVTGANGFVGRHLCAHLARSGRQVIAAVRPGTSAAPLQELTALKVAPLPLLGMESEWRNLLANVDSVIHLAARVHVMREKASDPLAEFRKVNVEGSVQLARAAADAGVRRFIYVSSIKVNGEATTSRAFGPDDAPAYADPYGQSKWEAEQRIAEIADAHGMEWAVVRPPLVYGPGVRGNFLALIQAVRRGLPFPVGAIQNRRSLVSVYNLVDLLEKTIDHPRACSNRFLVKDPEDLSTADLVRRLAGALHCRPRIISVSARFLVMAGKLMRRETAIHRLCSSLVLDTAKTAALLEWRAPLSLDSGLERTCEWFKAVAPKGTL